MPMFKRNEALSAILTENKLDDVLYSLEGQIEKLTEIALSLPLGAKTGKLDPTKHDLKGSINFAKNPSTNDLYLLKYKGKTFGMIVVYNERSSIGYVQYYCYKQNPQYIQSIIIDVNENNLIKKLNVSYGSSRKGVNRIFEFDNDGNLLTNDYKREYHGWAKSEYLDITSKDFEDFMTAIQSKQSNFLKLLSRIIRREEISSPDFLHRIYSSLEGQFSKGKQL